MVTLALPQQFLGLAEIAKPILESEFGRPVTIVAATNQRLDEWHQALTNLEKREQ